MHELTENNYIKFQAARVIAYSLAARVEKITKFNNTLNPLEFLDQFKLVSLAHTEPIKNFLAKFEESRPIEVMAERFIHPLAKVTKGSSRHLIYKGYQLKGCGRNDLIQPEDELHSWGGLYLYDALYAYLLGLYFDQSTEMGCIPYVGLTLYHPIEQRFSESKSLLIRETNCYRLAQFNDQELSLEDKEILKRQITSFHQTTDIKLICRKVIFYFAQLTFINSVPFSLSMDNICLDGRIIDIEVLNDYAAFDGEVLVLQVASTRENIENFTKELDEESFSKMELKFSNIQSIFFHLFRLFEAYESLFQIELAKDWIVTETKSLLQEYYLRSGHTQTIFSELTPEAFYSDEQFFREIDQLVFSFFSKYKNQLKIEWTRLINVENSIKVMLCLPRRSEISDIRHHFNLRSKNSVYYLSCKFLHLLEMQFKHGVVEPSYVELLKNSSQFNKLTNGVSKIQFCKMNENGQIIEQKYNIDQFLDYLKNKYQKEIIIELWHFSVFVKSCEKKMLLKYNELFELVKTEKEIIIYELRETIENFNYIYPTTPILVSI